MKRMVLLFLVLLFGLFAGCKSTSSNSTPSVSNDIVQTEPSSTEPSVIVDPAETEDKKQIPLEANPDLFDAIYAPFATRTINPTYNQVINYLSGSNYEYDAKSPSESATKDITVHSKDNEDYVYFAFYDRSSGSSTIMIVSYFQAATRTEVSLSNYSTDGSYSYDQLKTHVLGESNQNIDSVEAQRFFLFGDVESNFVIPNFENTSSSFLEETTSTENAPDYDSIAAAIIAEIPSDYQNSKWFFVYCDSYPGNTITAQIQVDLESSDASAALNLAVSLSRISKNVIEAIGYPFDSAGITIVNHGAPVGLYITENGNDFTIVDGGKRTEIT